MRFRLTARKSHIRATSTRSKRPAPTTKFLSYRLAEAPRKKFPPVPAPTRHPCIRRTEAILPGDLKRALGSKPINGDCSCKIDNRERCAISRRNSIARSEVLLGLAIQPCCSALKIEAQPQFSLRYLSAQRDLKSFH